MRFRVHRITTVQRVNPTVPFCGPLASGAVFYTFFGVVGRAHSIATPLTLMGAHPMPSKKVSRKRKSAKGHRRPSKARPWISPSPPPRRYATLQPVYHSLARTPAAPRPICPLIHWSPKTQARTSPANTDVLVREHITWVYDHTVRSSVVSTGWMVHPNQLIQILLCKTCSRLSLRGIHDGCRASLYLHSRNRSGRLSLDRRHARRARPRCGPPPPTLASRPHTRPPRPPAALSSCRWARRWCASRPPQPRPPAQ